MAIDDKEGPEPGEQGGESFKLPEVNDLKKRRQDLEWRIEQARAQKARDIEGKLTSRKELIGEEKKLAGILTEAQETLAYFRTAQELGSLEGKDLRSEIEELQQDVVRAEEALARVQTVLNGIAEIPEVFSKVWDEAHAVEEHRGFKESLQSAESELQEKAKELSAIIVNLREEVNTHEAELSRRQDAYHKAHSTINFSVIQSNAISALKTWHHPKRERTAKAIKEGYDKRPYAKHLENLETHRKSLGLLAGAEKAAIDSVLSHRKKLEELDRLQQEINAKEEELKNLTAQAEKLGEQLRQLVTQAWDKQNELTASHSQAAKDANLKTGYLAYKVVEGVQGGLIEIVNAGGYKGFKPKAKLEHIWNLQGEDNTRELYYFWDRIYKKAGGSDITGRRPE